MTWKKVAETDSIAKGKGREFKIENKTIAIFNQDGYHAIDGICVHQDGSIAPGKLDGDIVECPLHFWHYNIKTGSTSVTMTLQPIPLNLDETPFPTQP